jgi:hypothetical protein
LMASKHGRPEKSSKGFMYGGPSSKTSIIPQTEGNHTDTHDARGSER